MCVFPKTYCLLNAVLLLTLGLEYYRIGHKPTQFTVYWETLKAVAELVQKGRGGVGGGSTYVPVLKIS